jgi:hypothetical protein
VLDSDRQRASGADESLGQFVLELPHVSRPVVGGERQLGFACQALRFDSELTRASFEKETRQRKDILRALPEGGEMDSGDAQAE